MTVIKTFFDIVQAILKTGTLLRIADPKSDRTFKNPLTDKVPLRLKYFYHLITLDIRVTPDLWVQVFQSRIAG